jgi:hypothetical protein
MQWHNCTANVSNTADFPKALDFFELRSVTLEQAVFNVHGPFFPQGTTTA